jgi:hypothetical protein
MTAKQNLPETDPDLEIAAGCETIVALATATESLFGAAACMLMSCAEVKAIPVLLALIEAEAHRITRAANCLEKRSVSHE